MKSLFLDNTLQANVSLYDYTTEDLQVGSTVASIAQILLNAGKVETKGAEFELIYATPIDGLTLNGSLAYLDGEYEEYLGACYKGQTGSSAIPCFTNPENGRLVQDLAGTELARAPELSGNIGFNYERPFADGLLFGVLTTLSFSDDYLTSSDSNPAHRSPSYELLDMTLRLADQNETWEVALIGKNLTDEYYWVRGTDNPFTGSNATDQPGTGTEVGANTIASVSRGRELALRLTYRF